MIGLCLNYHNTDMEKLFCNINRCVWCNATLLNKTPRQLVAKDWANGGEEIYLYIQCVECSSWSLVNRPENGQLSLYYPRDYQPYAHQPHALHAVTPLDLSDDLKASCREQAPNHRVRILDYGCGSGAWLARAAKTFEQCDLSAVDFDTEDAQQRIEWINQEVKVLNPAEFLCGQDRYQLMNFGHSLEHLSDPVEIIRRSVGRLTDFGIISIALPIAESTSLKLFGPSWFALDAPRHFSIPSEFAVVKALNDAGMTIALSFLYGSPTTALRSISYAKQNMCLPFPGFDRVAGRILRSGTAMSILGKVIKPSKLSLVAVKKPLTH